MASSACKPWGATPGSNLETAISPPTSIVRKRSARETPSAKSPVTFLARAAFVQSILPMTNSYVPTEIQTDEGTLAFQDYFVRRRCEPRVKDFLFRAIEDAGPAPGVLEAVARGRRGLYLSQ